MKQTIINLWQQNETLSMTFVLEYTSYGVGSKMIYNKEVLKSNLYDYKDALIFIRGKITIIGNQVTQVAFKIFALFTKCMKKLMKQQYKMLKI